MMGDSLKTFGEPSTSMSFLLDDKRMVRGLCAGVVSLYLLLAAALVICFAGQPNARELSGFDRTVAIGCAAAGASATVTMAVSATMRANLRAQGRGGFCGTTIVLLFVSGTCALANGTIALVRTPIIRDPFTGKLNYMIRYAEWLPIIFIMTLVIEAIDAKGFREVLGTPALQALCVASGAAMPLAPNRAVWCVLCATSFGSYLVMIPRSLRKRRQLRTLRELAKGNVGPQPDTQRAVELLQLRESLKKAQAAADLHAMCTLLWGLFALIWLCDSASTLLRGAHASSSEADWAFMVECCLDTFTKLMYNALLSEMVEALPLLSAREQATFVRQRIGQVWRTCNDIIIISTRIVQLGGDGDGGLVALSCASPSVLQLLPADQADEWIRGKPHQVKMRSRPASSAGEVSEPPSQANVRAERSGSVPAAGSSSSLSSFMLSGDADTSELQEPPRSQSEQLLQLVERAWAKQASSPRGTDSLHFMHTLSAPATPLGRAGSAGSSSHSDAALSDAARSNGVLSTGAQTSPSEIQARVKAEGGASERVCEVCASSTGGGNGSADSTVIIVRDVTERVRRAARRCPLPCAVQPYLPTGLTRPSVLCPPSCLAKRTQVHAFRIEKELVSVEVARRKDAQTVEFTRHEVKNGLLASIAQCQQVLDHHDEGVRSGALIESQEHAERHCWLIAQTSAQLSRTLQTVLTDAMAREIVHGVYHAQLEPVSLRESLQIDGGPGGPGGPAVSDPRFPFQSTPAELPELVLDPRLVFLIYRNALSNAVKYGKRGGRVLTEAVYDGARTLTLRVTNEPGPGHERLRALEDPQRVFRKGVRLHQGAADEVGAVSAGHGAWIMAECARCHGGHVRIAFEPDNTVFEATLRAESRAARGYGLVATHLLPELTWAIGLDDSAVQRTLLGHMFAGAGISKARQTLLGRTAAEIEEAPRLVLGVIRAAPADAYVLLVADECLDLPIAAGIRSASGSEIASQVCDALPPERLARVLTVVRSAGPLGDEGSAGALRHVHGTMGKGLVSRASVLAVLLSLFERRFGIDALRRIEPEDGEDGGDRLSDLLPTPTPGPRLRRSSARRAGASVPA